MTSLTRRTGPGVSKSQLDDIADTPAIYLWRKNAPVDTEKTKTLDTGTAFHCRILEPEEFSKRFIIAPEFNRRTSAEKEGFDRRVLPELPGEWICTMKLSRRLWPGIKYSNMALYKSRKLSVQTPPGLHHHRALYDCYITAALLIDIMRTTGWTAEEMVNITGRPALLTTFSFGKYRGKAVSEVAKRDPGYLRWLFNNLDNMSPELRLTLKHYLEDVQAGEQRSNGTPQ